VTLALAFADEEAAGLRERRCIATGEVRAESALIRFAASPDGEAVPDIAARLPGRGMWVSADRDLLQRAMAKNAFSRAAKMPLRVPSDLVARVEKLLVQQIANNLGLARRSGLLVLGFDTIARAFAAKQPPGILIEARDGASDGRRKLLSVARQHGLSPIVMDLLTAEEMSLALGRENVIHSGLRSGPLAERILFDAGRLSGFRSSDQSSDVADEQSALLKDRDERDE
jgi:uncharacterized protein